MMYAFFRNLRSSACVPVLLAALLILPCAGTSALAASSRSIDRDKAPTTGLEGGSRHSYGPDTEASRDPRTSTPTPHDAYGNPIIPREPEEKPRIRPRAGAYGARNAQPERPLPDLPSSGSGWKFK